MKLILRGNPKSTNTIYKYRCAGRFPRMYMSPQGRKVKDSYIEQIEEQYDGEPLTGELAVNILYYFGTKRRMDIDNFNKILFDACNKRVWKDDVQITEMHVFKEYDKEDPRIELIIVGYED